MKLSKFIVAVAVSLASIGAQANLITNGSFENWTGTGSNRTLNGWITTGSPGHSIERFTSVAFGGSNSLTAQDGKWFIDLDNNKANLSISQNFVNAAGSFNLSFWYAAKVVQNVSVIANQTSNQINFVFGTVTGAVLDTVTTNVGWTPFNQTFTFLNTNPMVLTFSGGGKVDNKGGFLDNVIVTAVPEPSTYLMLLAGLGLMGTIAYRRRARRQN